MSCALLAHELGGTLDYLACHPVTLMTTYIILHNRMLWLQNGSATFVVLKNEQNRPTSHYCHGLTVPRTNVFSNTCSFIQVLLRTQAVCLVMCVPSMNGL